MPPRQTMTAQRKMELLNRGNCTVGRKARFKVSALAQTS